MRRPWIGLLFAGAAAAGSETPPPGPPWIRDLGEAVSLAEKTGRPVFVYLTKTY